MRQFLAQRTIRHAFCARKEGAVSPKMPIVHNKLFIAVHNNLSDGYLYRIINIW